MPDDNNQQNPIQPVDLRRDSQINTQPVSPVTNNNQDQFINPHNYQDVLGRDNVVLPPDQQLTPEELAMQKRFAGSQIKSAVPEPNIAAQYHANRQQMTPAPTTVRGKNDAMKLVAYIVPVIAIIFLLTKAINDEDFMWHVRQSLVTQALWYGGMIMLSILDLPIISQLGLSLWKIAGYGLLIYVGAMAYNHVKVKIPVVYDIGKGFIEGN
jgi:uncharacterized membrane protein